MAAITSDSDLFNISSTKTKITTTPMKTRIIILPQVQLRPAQKQAMWAIYQKCYNYTEARFMERLSTHSHVSLYLNAGKIIGFTGLRINKIRIEGRRHLLLYFGQTVILHEFRGQSLIQTTALKLVLKYWKNWLLHDVWFWYDALSYKAYLASAKCAHEMYPSCRRPITDTARQLRDFAGKTWYGDAYCPHTGTVTKSAYVLNDAAAHISPDDLNHPDVAFFARANPKHTDGHGLLTFVPVSKANLWVMVRRYWKRQRGTAKSEQKTKTPPITHRSAIAT